MKTFDKIATIICFIGLACPLWLGLWLALVLNAHAPGFRNEPPSKEEIEQQYRREYYRTLPQRIRHIQDSLEHERQRHHKVIWDE